METLKNLQVLALCYCFGEISSLSFQSSAPRLRKLKLERVSTQMTNDDLLILSRNCMNLTELSLVGCKRLNSGLQYSQEHLVLNLYDVWKIPLSKVHPVVTSKIQFAILIPLDQLDNYNYHHTSIPQAS